MTTAMEIITRPTYTPLLPYQHAIQQLLYDPNTRYISGLGLQNLSYSSAGLVYPYIPRLPHGPLLIHASLCESIAASVTGPASAQLSTGPAAAQILTHPSDISVVSQAHGHLATATLPAIPAGNMILAKVTRLRLENDELWRRLDTGWGGAKGCGCFVGWWGFGVLVLCLVRWTRLRRGDVSFEIVSLLHTVVSGSLEVLRNDGGFEPLRSSLKLSKFCSNYW